MPNVSAGLAVATLFSLPVGVLCFIRAGFSVRLKHGILVAGVFVVVAVVTTLLIDPPMRRRQSNERTLNLLRRTTRDDNEE